MAGRAEPEPRLWEAAREHVPRVGRPGPQPRGGTGVLPVGPLPRPLATGRGREPWGTRRDSSQV